MHIWIGDTQIYEIQNLGPFNNHFQNKIATGTFNGASITNDEHFAKYTLKFHYWNPKENDDSLSEHRSK